MKEEKIKQMFELFNLSERIDKTLYQVFHAYPHADKLIAQGKQHKDLLLNAMSTAIEENFTEEELSTFLKVSESINLKKWMEFFFSESSVISEIITQWLEAIVLSVCQIYNGCEIDPNKLN